MPALKKDPCDHKGPRTLVGVKEEWTVEREDGRRSAVTRNWTSRRSVGWTTVRSGG